MNELRKLAYAMPAWRNAGFFETAGQAFKRTLDVAVAGILMVLLAPLFVLIAMLVALDGGPVLFRHTRIGKQTKPFGCLKFRTMIVGAEECLQEYLFHHPHARFEWKERQKLGFDPRITPIGRFLRSTSLDEIPQIFNVLRGEMSLVGPRPVTKAELAHYKQHVGEYASVLPGITGLWQVSGRNDVSYDRRVEYDREYVKKRSILLDLKILLRTPGVVWSRRGAE